MELFPELFRTANWYGRAHGNTIAPSLSGNHKQKPRQRMRRGFLVSDCETPTTSGARR
jgi:hypothetical protein